MIELTEPSINTPATSCKGFQIFPLSCITSFPIYSKLLQDTSGVSYEQTVIKGWTNALSHAWYLTINYIYMLSKKIIQQEVKLWKQVAQSTLIIISYNHHILCLSYQSHFRGICRIQLIKISRSAPTPVVCPHTISCKIKALGVLCENFASELLCLNSYELFSRRGCFQHFYTLWGLLLFLHSHPNNWILSFKPREQSEVTSTCPLRNCHCRSDHGQDT